MPDAALTSLADAIRLAVAPVFLLSGIAGLLGVLTHRLARIIDRMRALEAEPAPHDPALVARVAAEVGTLRGRIRHINRAITLCTVSALLVAAVVAAMFVGVFGQVDLAGVIAGGFVLAMVALVAGLTSFLGEVWLTTRHWRRALTR